MFQSPELTSNVLDNDNKLTFSLKNIHFSTVNALRRTIVSDIPVYGIQTQTEENNQCHVHANTSRFHNEILKQRLSCIPVHYKVEKEKPIDKSKEPWDSDTPYASTVPMGGMARYELEVEAKNDDDHQLLWVTTEDFKLKDKETKEYLSQEEVRKIFPPNEITGRYIDFVRLLPRIGQTIPGEQLKLSADFSVCTAKENGMFNAATICTYHNTLDTSKRDAAWGIYLKEHTKEFENKSEEEKEFEKQNFYQLQGQRFFVCNDKGEPNEFSFTVQSVGIYESTELVQTACDILIDKLRFWMHQSDADLLPIIPSDSIRQSGIYSSVTESSMPFSYDIVLENEDYTIGCILEHVLYDMYFEREPIMTFVGFKKYHPHDTYSIVRVAYKEDVPILTRKTHLQKAIAFLIKLFQDIGKKIV